MPAVRRPRRGSMAYWPKKRARRIYPELKIIPNDKIKLQGFAAYKAGMTHCTFLDSKKGSPTFGMEVFTSATVLDCPPLKVLGFRLYEKTVKGLRAMDEIWHKEVPKYTDRKVVPGNYKTEEKLKKEEHHLKRVSNIRFIVSTQPRFSGLNKKTPEIFELEIGGKDAKEKMDFAKTMLGRDIKVSDVFKEGELLDTIAITIGKGTQGPVKRFGVRIGNRHAKKKFRHVGALGAQVPRKVKHTVAQAGQLGFQLRTELNKRVLKMGNDGKEINISGGFVGYGLIKSDYLLLEGSVPGPSNRLIMLRTAIRPFNVSPVQIKEIAK